MSNQGTVNEHTAGAWGAHAIAVWEVDVLKDYPTFGEEPWTGDMAEEGFEEATVPERIAAPQAEQAQADKRRAIVKAGRNGNSRALIFWVKSQAGWTPTTQNPSDQAVDRAIGRHVAGGLQIGLRTL